MNPKILLAVLVLAMAVLGCAAPTPQPPTAVPTVPPTNTPIPTATPVPTSTPTTPPPPTATPTEAVKLDFFREEFDGDLDNFIQFVVYGDESGVDIFTEDSRLNFELGVPNTASYTIYNMYEYEDVRVEIGLENRGANSMDVALICRYSSKGWYEFAIQSNGLWYLWRHDGSLANGRYNLLYNSGSMDINMGKSENVYAISCVGSDLTLYINGQKAYTFTDNKYDEGKIGVGVSSYISYPVDVEFDYLLVEQP